MLVWSLCSDLVLYYFYMDGFLSLVYFWDNSFHSPVFIEEVDGIHHYRVDRVGGEPIYLSF